MSGVEWGALAVVVLLALPGGRWVWAWRRQQACARHIAPPPAPVVHHERDFYGSMTLAGEREFYEDDEDPAVIWAAFDRAEHFLTAPPADPVPWGDLQAADRIGGDDLDGEQTAAWFRELREDPGPGVEAVVPVDPPPGPVQAACPRCGAAHKEPHCADGREWGPWPPEPTRLATAADVDAARPWLDVQLEDLYVWVRGVLAA